MTRTISQKLANMERRALAICALASLGKCHGVSISVTPRRGYTFNTAEETIDIRWELCDGAGIHPARYTECVLDNLWTETRGHSLTVDRMTWQTAVLRAAQLPGDTAFSCLWCSKPSTSPEPHPACAERAHQTVRPEAMLRAAAPELRTVRDAADDDLETALNTLAVR